MPILSPHRVLTVATYYAIVHIVVGLVAIVLAPSEVFADTLTRMLATIGMGMLILILAAVGGYLQCVIPILARGQNAPHLPE